MNHQKLKALGLCALLSFSFCEGARAGDAGVYCDLKAFRQGDEYAVYISLPHDPLFYRGKVSFFYPEAFLQGKLSANETVTIAGSTYELTMLPLFAGKSLV